MAEEFVRKEHFEEFSLRMHERFLSVEKQMGQSFAHAEKAREQNLVHLREFMKQGFDNLEKRFDDQRRIVLIILTASVSATIVAVVGAAVKYIFFSR